MEICRSGSQWRKDRVQGELALAQPLFGAELLQFRRADFPIIGRDRDIQSRRQAVQIFVFDLVGPSPAMIISRFASRLRSWRKIPIHHKAVQSRDAAPAHCRVRSELESAFLPGPKWSGTWPSCST
jgi:hypothetical protein